MKKFWIWMYYFIWIGMHTMKKIHTIQQQLATIIGAPFELSNMNKEEIERYHWSNIDGNRYYFDAERSYYLWLCDEINADSFQVLILRNKVLNEQEIKLINLVIATMRQQEQGYESSFIQQSEEVKSKEFGYWLHETLAKQAYDLDIPQQYIWNEQLKGHLLPFLLHCEENFANTLSFNTLSKLLRSYFGKGTVLIPIDQDWLILLGNNIVSDLKEDNEEHTELSQDMLMGLCEGLYEVISTEWGGGGLYLTVHEGLIKPDQLLHTIYILKETIELGQATSIGVHLHFAWQLQLERLVYSISTSEKLAIKEIVGTNLEFFKDEETLTTLESFFQLDCNVSETAKRLYIHRNTLLYRLDKIKQETGLDVKSFRDAVLMQLGLLLYKLTKKS